MNMDMDHGDHAQMTAECKRLGCTKKSIEDIISKVIQECITYLHKGSIFTQGKVQKNKSWFNTNVLVRRKLVTNDHYYTIQYYTILYFRWSASTLASPQLGM